MFRWGAALLLALSAWFAAAPSAHAVLYLYGRWKSLQHPLPCAVIGGQRVCDILPMQFAGSPFIVVGFDFAGVGLWLGLWWLFRRWLRRHPAPTPSKYAWVPSVVPIIAYGVLLPVAFQTVSKILFGSH